MNKIKTVIICEIGINHNGNMNVVKDLIDICSDLNIPYVKFQKRDINSCYTKEFLDSPRESSWGNTQRAQKEALELSLEQYQEIDDYCKQKGNIKWFASVWDIKSIDFLKDNFSSMPYLKIPSAKVTDELFLKKCVESGFDLIMSTGMSDLPMIQKAVLLVKDRLRFLLGCTSSYPTPLKDINLNQIRFLSYYFKTLYCDIGWSDHTGGILFPMLAVSFGSKLLEFHVTLDRRMSGSDQSSSIEPQGIRKLIKQIEELEVGIGEPKKEIQFSEIKIIEKLRNL